MPHLKKEITIFCFGFGQSARYFIKRLIDQKIKFKLLTTNTSETKRKKIFKKSYLSLKFKGTNYDKRIKNFITRSDYILVSIPPINKMDLVLRNFKNDLIRSQFLNLIYLSSTIPRPPPPSLRRLSPRGAAPSIPARCAYAPPSSAASSRSACSAYSLKYATTPSSPAFPK